MQFLTSFYTDVGLVKKVNQDNVLIKVANSNLGDILLTIVCDGLGGLSFGDIASKHVIQGFSKWFNEEFVSIIPKFSMELLKENWIQLIRQLNDDLVQYGRDNNTKLGTTITALMVVNDEILICHIGDSRAYRINSEIVQLTQDQSVVAEDLRKGLITADEARVDTRRNILLQCVGVHSQLTPEFIQLKASPNEIYLLCSDGLIKTISDEMLFSNLNPNELCSELDLLNQSKALANLAKKYGETDNISVVLVKTTIGEVLNHG